MGGFLLGAVGGIVLAVTGSADAKNASDLWLGCACAGFAFGLVASAVGLVLGFVIDRVIYIITQAIRGE
jgi:hypothetical protein